MDWMRSYRLAPLLLIAAVGCKSDPAPAGEETGSSTSGDEPRGSTTMGGQTSSLPPTTTTPPTEDDTTYGPGCGPPPCGDCDPGCEAYPLCIMSVWTCDCICPPTTGTGADVCDSLEAARGLWLDPSVNPPLDCGAVDTTDDAAAWQAVHDCVAASAMGSSFHGTWAMPELAPEVHELGAMGRFVKAPELGWFEVSGTFTLIEYSCEAIVPTMDCVVDVGEMCLTCEGQTEVEVHCTDE